MRLQLRHGIVVLEAALFILSVVILAIPEARTAPVRAAFFLLFVVLLARMLWEAHTTGLLRMTPQAIAATVHERPRTAVLSAAAAVLAGIAMMFI